MRFRAPVSTQPRSARRRFRAILASTVSAALALGALAAVAPAAAALPDLAQAGSITASASQNDTDGDFPASNAIDGNEETRWASGNGPDADVPFTADLTSDLGSVATVTGITLVWEAAFADVYDVQVASANPESAASWTTVRSVTAGVGGTENVVFDSPVEARYVRLAMLSRAASTWDPGVPHWYGYSLFTFAVNGSFAVPAVGFDVATGSVGAGADAVVGVSLTGAADTAQTVRVTSTGGSATAGTDYTAIDETLTFAPGTTTATIAVPTVSRGALAPASTVVLSLSGASSGLTIGARSTTTITITPTGELPNDGETTVFQDFEAGVPGDYSTWGSSDAVRPVLTTMTDAGVPGSGASNAVLTATVSGVPTAGDWFGFTNDTAARDWSASDGFSFWFLGTGSGKSLGYELKNGNLMFDRTVVDDSVGWRQVSVLFSDLRLKGAPSDPARFIPSASTGFAVTLTGLGAGTFSFDGFALFDRAITLEDFEGDVPIGSAATDPVGFFTWGSAPDLVTLGVEARERAGDAANHVLAGTYAIPAGGYGGFSDNLASSQDWSSFEGLRFWWYASQSSNPASPTAGDDIKVEIKDGGPDGEHSELWSMTFKDNWGSSTSRWKLVELPFSSFTLGGYQPGDPATRNGTLDLTSAWGFAPTMPPGKSGSTGWAIDDVQLYGTPETAAAVSVAPVENVYLVDAGATATVELAMTTSSGDPLEADATVDYSAGTGTAQAGTHFAPFSGSVTFPAGSASGTTRSFEVQTLAASGDDEARSIPVQLAGVGIQVPTEGPRVVINAHGLPYLDASLSTAERVDDLLQRMSLAEKVGQMTQAERLGLASPGQIAQLGLGSILSGGGSVPAENTPEGWADMIDDFQRQALSTSLQVPLLYGADAVHGHNNVVDATIFPHNIGLGATRDPALTRQIAEATGSETKATGVNWAFAPCLCVTRDDRWGRAYESFGEDPALVSQFAAGGIEGLQGSDPTDKSGPSEVLATAKHWVGDGGTAYDASQIGKGYPIDQGVTHADSLDEFVSLHVSPYLPAIAAGVGSIMPSYSGVDLGDGVVRMHENTALNTDLLKGQLDFDGFLISDWEGIDKLPGGTYAEKVVRSVNSGLDMAMAPYNFAAFITSVENGVASGAISQARVDDAVSRILTQKFELGLFENALTDRSQAADVGSAQHRAVAREAVAESQVLLKNSGVLPLSKTASIYVAGSNANDLGNQMGGWTISWQGSSGATTAGTTIAEGLAEVAPGAALTVSPDASAPLAGHDVGVVVVGETPYAEGVGDVGNNGHSLSLKPRDQAAIDAVCGAMECVVLVVAGRTQLVTQSIGAIDGLVASFLPGSEGAGVADVLFGDEPFTGRLPVSWPASAEQVPINVGDADYEPLYSFGWGERTDSARDRLEHVADGLAAGSARDAVRALLDADVWGAGGVISDAAAALPLVERVAALLAGDAANADLVVSLARDLAQAAIAAGTAVPGSMALTADAEHALLTAQPALAVQLLARVLGVVVGEPDGGKTVVSATLDPDRARIGQRVTATASGFQPGETVTGTIFSEPVALGSGTASAAGVVTLAFRVPAGVDIAVHRVALEGAEQIAEAELTVLGAAGASPSGTDGSRGSLATTGSEILFAVLLGLSLIAAGVVLTEARKRRRA